METERRVPLETEGQEQLRRGMAVRESWECRYQVRPPTQERCCLISRGLRERSISVLHVLEIFDILCRISYLRFLVIQELIDFLDMFVCDVWKVLLITLLNSGTGLTG